MSEFGVSFEGLNTVMLCDQALIDRLASGADEVRNIRKSLTIEIRQRSMIDSRLNMAAGELDDRSQGMRRVVNAGNAVELLYRNTEKGLTGRKPADMVWVRSKPGRSGLGKDGSHYAADDSTGNESSLLQIFDFMKSGGKFLDWMESDKSFGVLGDLGSYLNSLYEFFDGDKSGLGGLADWLNLAGDSVGLWGSLYELLDDPTFQGGFFTDGWRACAKGASLVNDLIGAVGSYVELFNCDEQTGFDVYVDKVVDAGASTADLVKSGLLLFADKGVGLSAHVYVSIAKAGISSVGQLVESIHEYSADGVWDLGDTGETLIDVSTEGLYSLTNALTFGGAELLLDVITGNQGKDVDYGDLFAQGVKDFGQDAAEWIVDTGSDISEAVDDAKEWIGDTFNNFCNGWKVAFA